MKPSVVGVKNGRTNMSFAAAVSRVVELKWIRLKRATLSIDSENVDSLPAELRFDTTVRHSHGFNADIGLIDVMVEYRLDVLNEAAGSVREAMVEAEFQLRYSVPLSSSFQSNELRWFAELNGTLNSWPYWREMAQTVLGRAGLGSLTLPLWRAPVIPVDSSGSPIKSVVAE